MYDDNGPRMLTPVIAILIAALAASLAYNMDPAGKLAWLRMFLWIIAIALAIVFVVTALDWFFAHLARRMEELGRARVQPAIALANAIRNLSNQQVELVARHDLTALTMVIGAEDPVFFVRGLTRDIPYVFVDDFIKKSAAHYPYLYPIRESGNEAWATDFTNLVIAKGWAEPAAGPFPAKLTIPLEVVARRVGVELEEKP